MKKGRVLTAGVGTSGAAAKKNCPYPLLHRNSGFFSFLRQTEYTGRWGRFKPDDVVIAISKGGNTEEIMKIVPAVKAKGASLIGVTENENSKLAGACNILLKVRVDREPDPFNMLATASTMAVIAVFDAIAIALMHYTGYKKDQFAVIHPGGAVGERLIRGEK